MFLTKTEIILKLQEQGFKARYSNICWYYNTGLSVVGGVLFLNSHSKLYFRVDYDTEIVEIVEGYDELHPFIFGLDKGE